MSYIHQVITVTRWEYRRFFKPKNELIGIAIMLLVSIASYFVTKYALTDSHEKSQLTVIKGVDNTMMTMLKAYFDINEIMPEEMDKAIAKVSEEKKGMILSKNDGQLSLHAYKKGKNIKALKNVIDNHQRIEAMKRLGISHSDLARISEPAQITETYVYSAGTGKRVVLAYFFAGLMVLAVFLCFAYQFTAITGEKNLKITEQIVSAIHPQIWMDGKIYGITLTGMSSMLTYSIVGIIGGILFFQFTGSPVSTIMDFVHLPSILLFLPFALTGILIWNAILAAIASVITDPNNSGKSSLMMLPVLFVSASFLVTHDPDSNLSLFLSWFPLTSASSMPIRWAITEVEAWEIAGSYILLVATFYFFRKAAAKMFRVSILISGKELSWRETFRLMRQSAD